MTPGPAGRTSIATAACVIAAFVAVAAQPEQDLRPTFRTEASYVEVDVIVTNEMGGFERGLRQEDFEVLEDGAPQDISAFRLVDLPDLVPLATEQAGARTVRDVRSNEDGQGRVFVLLLDDLHTHPLRSVQVKDIARRFAERYVGPQDLVSVIHTSGRAGASQEFTSQRSLLLASIDEFAGRKVRSALLERLNEHHRRRDLETGADLRMQHVPDPLDAERARQAQALLQIVSRLGDRLGDIRGRRKSVLLISEGIDYDVHDSVRQTSSGLSTFTSPYAQSVLDRFTQAIRTLVQANVTVFGIDPRGLVTSGDEAIEIGAFPENPLLGLTASALQDEQRRAHDSLRLLSDETGGFASIGSNDLSTALGRIVRESTTYYMLGYHSANTAADGRFRRIVVRVKDGRLQVRARRGYVPAPAGDRSATAGRSGAADLLREALHSPIPVGGIPLRAFAAVFQGRDAEGSVLVGLEVGARDITFAKAGRLHTATVDAAVVAVDAEGAFLEGDHHSVELQLTPDTYERVRTNGLRLLFRINLPPGRYQLRAAARDAGAAAAGSVHYDIEVPDFRRLPLTLSDLVLTSGTAAATPTPRPDGSIEELLHTPPTGARTFAPEDTLQALFVLYGHPARSPDAVDVRIAVVAADGQRKFSGTVDDAGKDLRSRPDGLGYVVDIPLTTMRPGTYLLRVEAVNPRGGSAAVMKELAFDVRASGEASP